jgi:hypothetical protein
VNKAPLTRSHGSEVERAAGFHYLAGRHLRRQFQFFRPDLPPVFAVKADSAVEVVIHTHSFQDKVFKSVQQSGILFQQQVAVGAFKVDNDSRSVGLVSSDINFPHCRFQIEPSILDDLADERLDSGQVVFFGLF